MSQCCKTCRYLDVPLTNYGRRVVRKDRAYQCHAPMPDIPKLPDSVTEAYGFKVLDRLSRSYMTGDRGTDCPAWEAMK